MNNRKFVGFFVFIFTFAVYAKIIEIHQLKEAMSTVTSDTLLVFDLDNTLFEPVQALGSDQWFNYHLRHLIEGEKLTEDQAFDRTIPLWTQIQMVSEVQLIETATPGLIRQKQNAGIKIMGLTARPVELSERTRQQLKSVDIDLSEKAFQGNDVVVNGFKGAKYTQGILFNGKNNKGKVLKAFLEQIQLRPLQIVFVDDRIKNVKNLDDAFSGTQINLLAYRYGALDEKVRRFELEYLKVADLQLRYLNRILSDEDAKFLLTRPFVDPKLASKVR